MEPLKFPARTPRPAPLFWIVASAGFYLIFAYASMREFGVASPSAVIEGLRDPGSAYFEKFRAFEQQLATGNSNPILRVLTLLSGLSAPLAPFLVIYWRTIPRAVKILAILALAMHVSLYLAIGTLVGLGNLVIFLSIGAAVAKARSGPREVGSNRKSTALILLGIMLFAGYMSYNQSGRIETADGKSQFKANPLVAAVLGADLAQGASAAAFYPTHGYIGLSHSLTEPFVWTKGRGASRALDGYLTQYGYGESQFPNTYPLRTQRSTGRDAGLYWSTIYPWIASDLTFPGTLIFMGFVGWWLAKLWHEATDQWDDVATLLLTQVGLLVAFVPANNQVVISRAPLICLISVLGLYFASKVHARLAKRRIPRNGGRTAARSGDRLGHAA